MSVSIVVLSCDERAKYWDIFFKLKSRYWKECPYPIYLVSESLKHRRYRTININSPIWTKRFREALKQVDEDYVIILLEDYFLRQIVDQERLSTVTKIITQNPNIATFNFERNYREALPCAFDGWLKQKNNQVYLNSTQPSIWNKQILMDRLREDQDPWQWELTVVNSPYDHLINTGNPIINNGYQHGKPFGIMKGEMTEECISFLRSKRLL